MGECFLVCGDQHIADLEDTAGLHVATECQLADDETVARVGEAPEPQRALRVDLHVAPLGGVQRWETVGLLACGVTRR